ncbi:MAG: hypothetical protein ACRDPY_44580, partial [Streptosporangiaceae bacterium]
MTMPTERGAEIGAVLGELTAARVPWLALALPGSAAGLGQALSALAGDAVVIDLTDPQLPPVMVNPLEPERGYPVQAHADRLAGLFEAAFALPDPVATAIRTGLRRAYANSGWDALTGAAPPALVAPAAVPAFHQLRHAVLAAGEDLGYDRSTRAAVRGFVQARLEPLWAGPAGRFLEGGHPADVGRLLKGNIVLLASGLADEEALFFLSGVLLIRIAESLRGRDGSGPARGGRRGGEHHRRPAQDSRFAIVVTGPGSDLEPGPLAAEWLRRMLQDLHAHGAEVIVSREPWSVPPARAGQATAAPGPDQAAQTCTQVLRERRSAACGSQCTRRRPCDGYELSAADLLGQG